MLTVAAALAYRWRGTGNLALGRPLCALLIALPLAWENWIVALAVFAFSWRGVAADHDPSGKALWQNADSGLRFTEPAAFGWLFLGAWPVTLALMAAGALKAACCLLPEGTRTTGPLKGRFVWRELAFGACWGLACDLALIMEVLS